MQLKEITLQNFRSYKDSVTIKDFSSVNTFIGPNTAGKSSILEAIRYLRALAGIGESPKGFHELVFDRNTDLKIRIEISLSLSPAERAEILDLLFGNSTALSKQIAFQEIKKNHFLSEIRYACTIQKNGIAEEEISTKNVLDGSLPILRWRTHEQQIVCESIDLDKRVEGLSLQAQNIPATFMQRGTFAFEFRALRVPSTTFSRTEMELRRMLVDFMALWIWFPPIRQAAPTMPLGEERTLLPSGTNLAKFLNTLQSQSPRRFVALTDKIIEILPFVEEILAPTKGSEATLDVHERGLRNPVDLGNVSFGFTQILILVYGIVTSSAGSVILVEEPELHLHASSQRRLFELIQKEGAQKQFFLTTHCSVLTGCDQEMRTYLVTKHNGLSSIKQIQEPSELRLVKTALGHRNTDLYGDECVVFIEGDSEEVAFPILADALGYDLTKKGIRLVNLRGSGKAKKIEEYLRYLKDSDVLTYVIADGDKEVSKRLADWTREGLLREGCATVWSLEFEDCFDLETLAVAMDELRKEEKWDFSLTAEELKARKEEGKSIVKLLQKLMYEKDLPSLHKPALAEKIANKLKEDIQTKKRREKTLPEKEIDKIVNLVNPRKEIS